jgi:hypothetical protein
MINKTVRLSSLALLLIMTACTSTTGSSLQPSENHLDATSDPSKKIFFPRQEKTDGERAVMEALVRGTLVLVDNCIRVQYDEVGINYLLIWPPDFSISFENGTIEIVNEDGKIVASLGDNVQMGGGEIKLLSLLDKSIQEQVPPQCPGPYWIVGEGFTRVLGFTPYPPPYP